ncbi:MAG: hypothetical protein ABIG10_01790 [bacterium]
MLNTKILLGLTTTQGSNWQDKVKEISQFNIKEIGLLPTTLNYEQRGQLYKMLQDTPLETIPFVHLRHDMEQKELDYLVAKYKTKIFCSHANEEGIKLIDRLPKYLTMIYLENDVDDKSDKYFNAKVFDEHKVAGICLDLAHLENQRNRYKQSYKRVQAVLNKYPIGCNHVSAVKTNILLKLFHRKSTSHELKNLDDLDYLRKFSKNYFAKYIVIELENSFQEQLEIKKHLENMLEYVIN